MTDELATFKYPITEHLHALKLQTGWSTYQLGRYLGVPQHTINNWLSERRQMSLTAERLLTVLNLLRALAPELHEHMLPPPAKADKRKKENWTLERKVEKSRKRRSIQPLLASA